MHRYRCQNIYILATASERIVDTLEFFPHNFQMPQLSSTDRLIMAANDMSNALKNLHPEVPFPHIRNNTITALTTLAEIFKNKFQKVQIPGLPTALTELGHIQPRTPLHTDNSTAFGILNEKIKQKRSKAMDMRYHWLTDRVRQKQFDVYWRPGRDNLGDYHKTHHSAQHHKDMRGLILLQVNSLQVLRGCVKLRPLPQPQLRAHIRTYKSKRPESHSTKECACTCVLCPKKEPKYYYCTITLVMT
jgi:hypothetical protein